MRRIDTVEIEPRYPGALTWFDHQVPQLAESDGVRFFERAAQDEYGRPYPLGPAIELVAVASVPGSNLLAVEQLEYLWHARLSLWAHLALTVDAMICPHCDRDFTIGRWPQRSTYGQSSDRYHNHVERCGIHYVRRFPALARPALLDAMQHFRATATSIPNPYLRRDLYDRIIARAAELGVDTVRFRGRNPRPEVPVEVRWSDVGRSTE